MKRRIERLFMAALLLAGCKSAPSPLVGVWELQAEGTYASIEFKPDGTYETLMPGPVRTIKGRYQLDGRNLTMTTETHDGKPKEEPDVTVTLAEDMKSFRFPGLGPRFVKR